jgi:hypothetical protein
LSPSWQIANYAGLPLTFERESDFPGSDDGALGRFAAAVGADAAIAEPGKLWELLEHRVEPPGPSHRNDATPALGDGDA